MKQRINRKWVMVLLLCMIGFVIVYQVDSTREYDRKAKIGTLDHKSKKEIEKIKKDRKEEKRFVVKINPLIILKEGTSEGVFNIENAPENNYMMEVEIYKKEDSKKIYQSQWIRAGEMIEKDCLDTPLKKGEYLCEVNFIAIDEENHEEVGRSSYETIIQVQK